jgi:magnesium-transporting ATPase (P-type)
MSQVMPLSAAGGALVTVSGLARGQPLLAQLAVGASLAIAALPEGLPLLAGTAQAAVARRLMRRQALVHRLSAVEALGRVDVACADKTGTLTEGRLALRVVADLNDEAGLPAHLSADLRQVLLTAAFASPHPDAADVGAHPTDLAVAEAARAAGLVEELRADRAAESPFEPTQSFHAAVVRGRLCIKGAPEVLLSRCTRVRRHDHEQPLNETYRQALQARAQDLAERGLRVLMVADGPAEGSVDDPQQLTALGFVGISDPLRPGVPAAIRRCHDAGIRVIMLTGDHPATARAIAREAGLLADEAEGARRKADLSDSVDTVLTATEIAELEENELDQRLEGATVIARATPLDKLRIVESLQRRGHTVAMTGDGVNDAPALRLADVGVAMGRGGTEVARQAADVVLADDDFATLVEALVEGRSFWRNIRRALGLLLGGNLGELGLVVPASVLTLTSPLTTRQILAVNLITDALPALAVALQPPEHRNLAALAREGTAALDAPLHRDVAYRATSTAAPSLAAYLIALSGGLPSARSVAFASIVATQLAQTLDAGWAEGSLTRPVLGAVTGSAGVLIAALTVPPMRDVLSLVTPTPLGWTLVGTGAVAAVLLNRVLASAHGARRLFPALAPPGVHDVLSRPAEPLLLPAPKVRTCTT